MVFQEPQSSLNPVRTHRLAAHPGTPGTRDGQSTPTPAPGPLELLTQVEIPDPQVRLDQYPHQLSGGQKQRVVLAIALANNPEILLADEPTTALDVTVQREILELLRRLRDTTGMSIVMITHNMGVVGELADRVVVMRAGSVLETGRMAEVFARPAHPYTLQLLDSVMELPRLGARGPVGPPSGSPARAARHAAEVVPRRWSTAASRSTSSADREARFPAVNGVDLVVRPGEVAGARRRVHGSGKTTLGRLAVGLAPLSAGSVHLDGVDLGVGIPRPGPAAAQRSRDRAPGPRCLARPPAVGRAEHPGTLRHRRDQHPERAGCPGPGAARGGAPARVVRRAAAPSCPAASASASPWLGPWSTGPPWSSPTSRRARSTSRCRPPCWSSSGDCRPSSPLRLPVHQPRPGRRAPRRRSGRGAAPRRDRRVRRCRPGPDRPPAQVSRALVGAVPRVQHLRVPAQEL